MKTEANWPFYLFFAFLGFVTFALPGTTIFQSLLALVARLKENPDPVAWGQVFAALWILSVSTGLFFREVRLQKQKGGLDRSELLFGIPLLTSGFLFLISGNFLGVTGTFWFESGHSRLMGNSEVLDGNEWAIFYGTLVVFSALWMWVAIRYSKNWQGDGGFQSWMKKHWVMQDLETLGEIVLKKLDRVLSWNGFSAGPAMGAFFHRSFYFLGEGLRRFENRTVQGIRSSERVLTEVLPQAFQLPLKGTVSTELVWILGGVLVLILHFGLRLNHG